MFAFYLSPSPICCLSLFQSSLIPTSLCYSFIPFLSLSSLRFCLSMPPPSLVSLLILSPVPPLWSTVFSLLNLYLYLFPLFLLSFYLCLSSPLSLYSFLFFIIYSLYLPFELTPFQFLQLRMHFFYNNNIPTGLPLLSRFLLDTLFKKQNHKHQKDTIILTYLLTLCLVLLVSSVIK